MGIKQETTLQQDIQELIEAKGGYVNKNWGSMISEPGIADLTICYKGLYIAIEVKVNDNDPSPQQGIHCRKVLKANGISAIIRSIDEIKRLLNKIDFIIKYNDISLEWVIEHVKREVIDNGSSY